MGFKIVFNAERLEVISEETSQAGIWLTSAPFPDPYTPGEVHFTGFQTGAGVSGNDILLGTVSFRCVAAGASEISLRDRGPTDDFVLTDGTILDEEIGEGFVLSDIITSADLAVEKADGPDPVRVGEALFYTLTVTNLGPSQALNVTLTDQAPAVLEEVLYSDDGGATWEAWPGQVQLGSVDAGSSHRILLQGTIASFQEGSITNTAGVVTDSLDPDETNNGVTATTRIMPKRGDFNGDDALDLKDAIMALRICVRLQTDTPFLGADATGDKRIGMDDIVFILKSLASQTP
jgi:uncharacterized repeat protein (TIGR01451 family)